MFDNPDFNRKLTQEKMRILLIIFLIIFASLFYIVCVPFLLWQFITRRKR